MATRATESGKPVLTVTNTGDPVAEAVIDRGLAAFNAAAAGYQDWLALNVTVADPASGATIGGMIGRTSYGLLFIDLLFLPEALRGNGIGGEILELAEAEARRRGCRAAVLYTISFQAPGFYEKHGYSAFGRVDCDPPGTARVFFGKNLVETGA